MGDKDVYAQIPGIGSLWQVEEWISGCTNLQLPSCPVR